MRRLAQHLSFPQLDNVLARRGLDVLCDFPKERWRNVPSLTIVRDHCDRLAVVTRQHPGHLAAACWLKRNTITNLELQHLRVSVHLLQEPQPFHDAIVEINELSLGQIVDVDLHRATPVRTNDAVDVAA